MPTESPAEKMHNRILNGSAYFTHGVTVDAFEEVARRAGTLELPDVKAGLARLRKIENLELPDSREKPVM
jgi:hypothetical protein